MSEEQLEFLQEGLIYCPSCNRSERIELIYVENVVDRRVIADGETPNVYPVSLVKCHYCSFTFELERVDPRVITTISEIAFPNDFTVYTTSNINEAIDKAKQWYNEHFDGQLGEPTIQTVGTTVYTHDPYDIIIPSEEGEEQ